MTETTPQPQKQSVQAAEFCTQTGQTVQRISGEVVESLIPMSAGLLATRFAKVGGWMSIPVYLVAATVTREVMEQLNVHEVFSSPNKTRSQPSETVFAETPKVEIPENAPYKIIHATPGRIRLRIPKLADDSNFARLLEKFALGLNGVSSVRVNRVAASIVITYDVASISNTEMKSHLANFIVPTPPKSPQSVEEEQKSEEDSNSSNPPSPPPNAESGNSFHRKAEETENKQIFKRNESSKTQLMNEEDSFWSGFKSSMMSCFLNFMAGDLRVNTPVVNHS
ncbi:MAG: HMA2 domain-containing protein [Chroococcales cyanobacterium]